MFKYFLLSTFIKVDEISSEKLKLQEKAANLDQALEIKAKEITDLSSKMNELNEMNKSLNLINEKLSSDISWLFFELNKTTIHIKLGFL